MNTTTGVSMTVDEADARLHTILEGIASWSTDDPRNAPLVPAFMWPLPSGGGNLYEFRPSTLAISLLRYDKELKRERKARR